MVFPVRLPNRFELIFLLWCAASMSACVHTKDNGNPIMHPSGLRQVQQSDTNLKQRGGFLWMNDERYSGWVISTNNDDTLYKCFYTNGKQEGIEQSFYENMQPNEVRFYKKGYKEGEHKAWYANGQQRFIYHYKNDVYEGNVKEWMENGQLIRDFNYKNGHENGRQRMWYADGRILANYDVRNGRKYGLTGVKNCVSVWEDRVK
jgi:antitoxin component YwqK of YwqJK toxin-antitoxin module